MKYVYVINLILLWLALSTDVWARNRKEKDRKKDKSKYTMDANLCTIDDISAPMHCFCDSQLLANASDAKCWIFTGLTMNHSLWSMFTTQPHIKELTITVRPGGQFTFVPTKGLVHLRNLQTLEIKYANIASVHPYAFANLTTLKEITVSRNQIVNLTHHAFAHLPNLLEITIDENRISELNRDVFVELPSLQKLFIDQNNLSVIHDGAFRHLASLLELELDNNYISVLTRDTFIGLSGLKRIDLTANRISMLGDLTFAELWNLEALLLDSNQIEMISNRAFAGLTHLKRLSLNENRLTMLTGNLLTGVPAITFLDLRSNVLQTLTFDVVRPILHNLYNESSYFLLEKNQFVCDCRLSWMYKLRNETKNERVRNSLDELTCHLEDAGDFKPKPVASTKMATPPPKSIRQPYTPNNLNDYNDPSFADEDDEYLYQDQENNSNSLSVTQQEDPFVKHLFQIPLEQLPCPRSLHSPTETTHRIEATPPPDFPFMLSSNKVSNMASATVSIILGSLVFLAYFT